MLTELCEEDVVAWPDAGLAMASATLQMSLSQPWLGSPGPGVSTLSGGAALHSTCSPLPSAPPGANHQGPLQQRTMLPPSLAAGAEGNCSLSDGAGLAQDGHWLGREGQGSRAQSRNDRMDNNQKPEVRW